MTLKCVLWDFGDTLVDEKFMRQSPPTVPQWGTVWAEVVSGSTLNPDLFSDLIVPQYRLDAVFRVIVASWKERTLDKGAMCRTALKRLGGGIEPVESLLIDNKAHNVEAWATHGGTGYLYRGEDAFRDALAGELRELADSARG
jgi:hypothetical protein